MSRSNTSSPLRSLVACSGTALSLNVLDYDIYNSFIPSILWVSDILSYAEEGTKIRLTGVRKQSLELMFGLKKDKVSGAVFGVNDKLGGHVIFLDS
jgi:hypothetical protein